MTKPKTKKLRPPVKTHGGKFYLAQFIIDNFPKGYEQMAYCEPFCAGASVFLNKARSPDEVISDLDRGIVCVMKAIRDEVKEFTKRLKRVKYSERAFKLAQSKSKTEFDDYMDHAVNEYTLRRMSRGGLKKAFAWSERKRGGKPGDVNAWNTMLKQLPHISERLQGVTILHSNFVDVFKAWDDTNSLIYLDPPYLHSTRSEGSTDCYENEMTVEDHITMLSLARNCKGKVIISGYFSPLYKTHLKNFRCKKKEIANHSGQAKTKERRVECLWMNY